MQELVRVNRKVIKLITKMLPIMEHYVCTSFGMSKVFYRGKKEKHVQDKEI